MSLDVRRYKILKASGGNSPKHKVGDIVDIPVTNKTAILLANACVCYGAFELVIEPLALEKQVRKILYNEARNAMDERFKDVQKVYSEYFLEVLNTLQQHLKDLEATGDITINSGMTWEGLLDMYKKEIK